MSAFSDPIVPEAGRRCCTNKASSLFWGDEVYLYDAQHYLAVSVPVPFSMDTDASAEEPLFAIYLRLDFKVAAELMMKLDEYGTAEESGPEGVDVHDHG